MRAKCEEAPEEEKYIVEGYAARFEPYVLFTDDNGNDWTEVFEKDCFKDCDMSDVIMQYDHQGRVFARTSNGTLQLDVDDEGLHIRADLSKTELSRQLYEDINAGMITKMSWRFSLGENEVNTDKREWRHYTVSKMYDVSAVSIPANDSTSISAARSYINGVIDIEARREAELDIKRKKLALKLKLGGLTDDN